MKKMQAGDPDPLVLEATMTGDDVDLVLTKEGYETLEQALDILRETNPQATYKDVLRWAFENLIDELEAMN